MIVVGNDPTRLEKLVRAFRHGYGWSEDEWSVEEKLAMRLLFGWPEETRSEWGYLKSGTAEEKEARAALASILRGEKPVRLELLRHLANLFDPSGRSGNPRKLVFENRRAIGRPHAPHIAAVVEIYNIARKGEISVSDAKEIVAKRFGLSEDDVNKAWSRHWRSLERLNGPVPRKQKRKPRVKPR
jgi:hypothetical protein